MKSESDALVPVEQREVAFYGDDIIAVRLADGGVFVPVKPICDLIGVGWGGQFRRLQRDPVLSEETRSIAVASANRGTQPMVCLPLDYVSGFLFGLNADRVKAEKRERVILYQRECYKVLAEAFYEGRLTLTDDETFDELLERSNSAAVEAYRMAQAIAKLARSHILIEARLDQQDRRFENYDQRLEAIESTLGDPDRQVTPEQAAQISQAVKTIAFELGKRTKRNEFGGVYGELYRRFGVNSYKAVPAAKFDSVMAWLNEWLQAIIDGNPF